MPQPVTGRSRFDRLSTPQLLELFAWQDSGLSYEAALEKVEGAARASVAESQTRLAESQGDAAYQALFGDADSLQRPPAALSEASSGEATRDPYEALFGRGAR